MNTILTEKDYQKFIIQRLVENNYVVRNAAEYDRRFAMDPDMLFKFLEETQPQKMAKVRNTLKENYREGFLNFLNLEICKSSRSLIDVLKHGIEIANVKLDLLYTKPATSMNEKLIAKVNKNIFSVMEEVWASDKERIDLVIFLNGLAIISFELKCNQAGQNYTHAIHQYRSDRDPKTRLFQKKAGCFVNFAMDLEEVYMTTELNKLETYFLPFNIGRGEGINTGKGNPIFKDRYSVSYMWEDILTKDTLYDLIGKFVFVEKSEKKDKLTGKKRTVEHPIFPRYHQLRTIRKVVDDLLINHTSQNYLIQHSAGSGKTKTIAWLAHRLASLHDLEDKQIFDNIVIITDKVVVDRQLQDAVRQIDHKSGLIKVMDDSCSSDDLRKALEGNTKIIATTIQKFLYIVDTIKKINNKHFAVIIDEAHSSTAGKDMGAVTQVLGKGREVDDDEFEKDDIFVEEIRANGKQPNVSMFAFTATPKPTTLALFGRPGKSGQNEAFDLYSMKQAIEEEFILDVLTNYMEYKTYFDINKVIEDDPMYKSGKAKRKIARLVDLTDENIEKRTGIIIDHFRSVVMQELGGTAKAMVVTASRPAAVKYKLAFEKYISQHGYSDMSCFVAFSGKVKLDEQPGKEFTEMGMNGISEKALPDEFEKDENRILLVANKYQTGFDQPRLCAMYVLKKLKKIAAVQTLSRLNRICPPYKKKTFVLDFCNTYEDIKKSFAPYYTATILDNNITPSDIYKLETKLDGYGVLDEYDIDNFAELITKAKPTDRQKMQMTGYLQKAERKANNLPEDDKKEFIANLKRFVRFYEFLIMASQFEDVQLHKKYKFCSNLQSWFKKDQSGEGFSLKDQIVANNFQNELQGEYKKPNLVANPYVKLPEAEAQLSEDEEKKLSEIIEEINSRTGNHFDKDVAAQAMLQIKEILLKSQKLQQSALVNSEDEFKFSYFDDIDDALVQGLEQNQDFFSMLLSNPEIKKQVLGVFVTEVYKTLKNKETIDTVNKEESRMLKAAEEPSRTIPIYSDYREGCVPLFTLRAACGYFEDGEVPEEEGWVDASGNGFTPDSKRHFAVHAKGDSMLPKIKDGDICVFEWYRAGSRNGEIVLTECNEKDIDYGGMYTIKKYQSEKKVTKEGWQHTKVELIPLNKDYDTIELDGETEYRTIGILKCVL
jgi:type I restriction enzyme R subunit